MSQTTILFIAYLIASVNLIIGFSLYYIHLADLQSLIILHFQALRGADVLGSKKDVLGILLAGVAIAAFNFLLGSVFYNRRRYLSQLLAVITILVSFLILLAVIAIISVN